MADDWDDPYNYSCHSVGINGGCGVDCPVFLRGDCENEEEGLEQLGVSCIEDIGKEPEDEFADFDRAMEIFK